MTWELQQCRKTLNDKPLGSYVRPEGPEIGLCESIAETTG